MTEYTPEKVAELIEKAAKAMADAGDVGWAGHTESERDWYRRDARVALAVFRERTVSGSAPADDERARIEQSNEVSNIVFDEVKKVWPDLHPVLNLRYGIADALWDAGFRRGAPADPVREYVKARTGATDDEGEWALPEDVADAILSKFRLVPRGEAESDGPLNVERENAAAEYTRYNIGGMQPVMTIGERVHDAFVSGAEWAAGFRRGAPAEPEWEVQYGRRNRETGALHWLTGDPRDDWWHENQDRYEHVKRYTSPPLPVEGEKP